MGQQYKRHIYLIDRTFQLKFVAWFIAIMVVLVTCIGTVSYQVLNNIIEKHLYSPHISALSSGEIFRPALLWINCLFMGAFIVVSVVFIFFHLRRVSGSLKRFAAHLDKMRGHFLPGIIHFRHNDPLHLVANDFNVMSAYLEKKITVTQDSLQQAMDGIHDLRVSHTGDSAISPENFKDIQSHLVAAEKEIQV